MSTWKLCKLPFMGNHSKVNTNQGSMKIIEMNKSTEVGKS